MIPRKKKRCISCGREEIIWSHNRCKRCDALHRANKARNRPQELLSPSRQHNIPLKGRKSIYGSKIDPRTRKKTVTDTWLKEHWGFKSQVELFDMIWKTRKHICQFTGEDLDKYKDNEDMKRRCFAHVLPKGRFPLFKLNPNNVLLVSPEFHRVVDQGTMEERNKHLDWNFMPWDIRVNLLQEEYKTFQKKYLL